MKVNGTEMEMFMVGPDHVGVVDQSLTDDGLRDVLGEGFVKCSRFIGDREYKLYAKRNPVKGEDHMTVRGTGELLGTVLVFRTEGDRMVGIPRGSFDELILKSALRMELHDGAHRLMLDMTREKGKSLVVCDGS
jgi:hypothetical protein